jgi:hypothetical protein
MPGIMADHNIEGHFEVLLRIVRAAPWQELWDELHVEIASFASLGLSADASDAVLWRACQAQDIMLITANRNAPMGTPSFVPSSFVPRLRWA